MISFFFQRRTLRQLVVLSALGLVSVGAGPARLVAQDKEPEVAEEASVAEQVHLTTKDGVLIKATFYPGNADEKTVPLILLHDYKGDRTDLDDLAELLHGAGHAVIVPDLRGHGDSTRQAGRRTELIASRMTRNDYMQIVTQDMEEVKRYLMKQNNQAKLNIQKLGVVGFGMGASVAIAWAAQDWSWPEFPGLKQGRDVKSLVLVSPAMNLRGIKIRDALTHPAVSDALSVQLIVGSKKSDSRRDADSMYKFLTRNRPKQEEKALANREVFLEQMDTTLQGVKLLKLKEMLIDKRIAKFVQLRLTNVNLPSYLWMDRSKK